jgi:hypothetical protein
MNNLEAESIARAELGKAIEHLKSVEASGDLDSLQAAHTARDAAVLKVMAVNGIGTIDGLNSQLRWAKNLYDELVALHSVFGDVLRGLSELPLGSVEDEIAEALTRPTEWASETEAAVVNENLRQRWTDYFRSLQGNPAAILNLAHSIEEGDR